MSDILAGRQAVQSSAAEEAPSLVQAVLRRGWIVFLCMVLAGAAGGFLSSLQEPRYTATTRIFLSASTEFDPLETGQFVADAGRYASNQLSVLDSTLVLQTVINRLNLPMEPAQLRKDLKLSVGGETDVISVSATADQPRLAAQIADGVATSYQNFVADQVRDRAAAAESQVTVPAERAAIRAAAAVYDDGVAAIEKAEVPRTTSHPQVVRDGVVLALIGFFAAAGWAVYSQSWAKRRVGPAEASAIFGAPVLSEIPDRGRIGGPDEVAAAHSEPGDAYRMAAVGLDYIRGAAPGVFLVTAPHPGAGSSTTALNLAAAAADHGRRAFVISVEDGTRPWPGENDPRPRVLLHELTQGRIDLSQAMESREASRARFGAIRVLVVEPVQGHPVGDVQRILDQLPEDTDLVIIDSPPLPGSSGSFVLAGQVDAVIVVVDDTTTPADLEELQRRCRLAGVTVAGIIRNHIRRSTRPRRRSRGGANPPGIEAPSGAGTARKSGTPVITGDNTAPRGLPILNTGGIPLPTPAETNGVRKPPRPAADPPGRPNGKATKPTVAVPTAVRQPPQPKPDKPD